MPTDRPTHYSSFHDLLEEITYAHEDQYPPRLYTHNGIEYAEFYKLTLCSKGLGSYKTSQYTFEPHLWWKVKKMVELLTPSPAEKVLYEEE